MRNKRWLRYGLGSAAVGCVALAGLLVACGDDDDNSSGGVKTDSGTDTGQPGNDGGGGTDSGQDARPDSGTPAKIVLVHAATDLGPANTIGAVRVCFATATKANPTDADFAPTPLGALPDTVPDGGAQPFPGIFIGTGGPFAGTGTPLEPITIRPYVMNAQRLAGGGVVGNAADVPRCSKLLAAGATYPDGGEALKENVDFWKLADIPAGTLKQDKTYMLAVIGCTSDAQLANGSTDCGNGFTPDGGPGVGNLKILVLELDQAAVAGTEMGVQTVNLSPSHNKVKNALGNPQPFFPTIGNIESLDGGSDAGKFAATASGAENAFNYNATAASTMVKVTGLVTDTGYFAVAPTSGLANNQPNIAIPLHNKLSLSSVQRSTTGNTDPNAASIYVNGQAYTFVLVGDPLEPANTSALRQSRRLHFLGFPNKQP